MPVCYLFYESSCEQVSGYRRPPRSDAAPLHCRNGGRLGILLSTRKHARRPIVRRIEGGNVRIRLPKGVSQKVDMIIRQSMIGPHYISSMGKVFYFYHAQFSRDAKHLCVDSQQMLDETPVSISNCLIGTV